MDKKEMKISSFRAIFNGSESLLRMKDVLDEMKISFFLIHGTLLGLYRDGHLCAHETPSGMGDIDVASFDEMPNSRFGEFTRVVEKHGLKMFQIDSKEGYGKRTVGAYIRGTPWYLGIEFWKRIPEKNIVVTYDGLATCPSKFFETFKEINYLGRKFKIPGDTEGFLEYNYGKNWKTRCVQALADGKKVWVKCDIDGEFLDPIQIIDDISEFCKVQIIKKIP